MFHSLVPKTVLMTAILVPVLSRAESAPIQHRFLAIDESRGQVEYIDQTNPARNWTIKTGKCRDYQLIGGNRLMLSLDQGYLEYDLATKQIVKENKKFSGITFARRRANGTTILGGASGKGTVLYELDAEDKVLRTATVPFGNLRLGRLTPQGTVFLGADGKLVEAGLDGAVIHEFVVPGAHHLYQALRRKDGHLLVASGYGASLLELDTDGKVLNTFGGTKAEEAKELGYHFFAGFQVLKNGDIVVSNWTGHGANDSAKGTQLVQFNSAGKVIWKWHDPTLAGSLHGVIVLDDLDTNILNDDITSVLGR